MLGRLPSTHAASEASDAIETAQLRAYTWSRNESFTLRTLPMSGIAILRRSRVGHGRGVVAIGPAVLRAGPVTANPARKLLSTASFLSSQLMAHTIDMPNGWFTNAETPFPEARTDAPESQVQR